jgi:pimeloyl-ACP methyl ester carboxylesterase
VLVAAGGAAGAIAVVALGTIWTPWALTGAAAVLVVVAGVVTGRRRWPGLTRVGIGALGMLLAARVVVADEGDHLRATSLPGAGQGRVVDRLVEEQDVVLSAAPLLGPMGLIPRGEGAGLTAALRREYARMRLAEGTAPSPFASTLLELDGPESFDVLWHAVPARRSSVAVLFLHGYGGSFALPCWEVASAAARAGMETACPSVGQRGDWWTARGEHIARQTIRWMQARGATRIVLAGLSNGGIGASRLAPRLRRDIDGLVLLSGAAPVAPPRGLPVLVVHGRQDTMTSPAVARRYARGAGRRGTLVLLDGDHFVLVGRAAEIQSRLTAWLAALDTTR